MDMAPRYHQLANLLRRDIEAGHYAIGSLLPTEHELCETHTISRHTARAALQLLEEDGLIERRRGAGTRVISAGTPPAFVQPLGGLDELLQYARDTRFEIHNTSRTTKLPANLLEGKITPKKWITLEGLRTANKQIVAAATVYVRDSFGDKPDAYTNLPYAITEYLRKTHGVSVGSINQSIHANLLHEKDAKLLGTPPKIPILKTIRRYFDTTNRALVISVNRHPADGFSYEMTYKRG